MPKLGVKRLIAVGFVGVAVGLLLTSGIDVHSSFATGVLPGMLVLGLSSGLIFPALTNASLHGVTGQDSSLASGVQTAVQQVGGALGLACLVTLALRHASGEGRSGVAANIASTDGYALAFRIGAGLLVVGAVLVLTLMEHVSAQPANPLAEQQ